MNDKSDSDRQKETGGWLLPHFPRLFDLYQHSERENPKNYFNVEFPLPLFEDEKRLARLDSESWRVLRDKAMPYVTVDDPLRRYQQLWSTLDEARGYVFLADKGYEQIEFIEPSRKSGIQSPDLIGCKVGSTAVLEVKTINESCDNLAADAPWRTEAVMVRPDLSSEFKRKIIATIEQATTQLESYPRSTDRKIVFVVIRFDNGQKTGGHLYAELADFVVAQSMKNGIEVYHQATL